MYKDVLLITITVVCIVDLSGFVDSVKSCLTIAGRPVKHLKPFDCSLCMTFWSGVVYLLATNSLNLHGVAVVCVASLLASVVKDVIVLLLEGIKALIRLVYRLIDKVD